MAQGINMIASPVPDCPNQLELSSSGLGISLKTHLFGYLEWVQPRDKDLKLARAGDWMRSSKQMTEMGETFEYICK